VAGAHFDLERDAWLVETVDGRAAAFAAVCQTTPGRPASSSAWPCGRRGRAAVSVARCCARRSRCCAGTGRRRRGSPSGWGRRRGARPVPARRHGRGPADRVLRETRHRARLTESPRRGKMGAERSGSRSGDRRGLQNRLRGGAPVLGGFDSHVAPPLTHPLAVWPPQLADAVPGRAPCPADPPLAAAWSRRRPGWTSRPTGTRRLGRAPALRPCGRVLGLLLFRGRQRIERFEPDAPFTPRSSLTCSTVTRDR